jgi:hypothetical protein
MKNAAGKVVVLLSSVAKPPPATTQPLLRADAPAPAPKKGPPPLPADPSSPPGDKPMPREATGEVKPKPRKKSIFRWPSFSGSSAGTPSKATQPAPPRLPGKHAPIKLNPSATETGSSKESIFSDIPEVDPTPKGWKQLHPGELEPPSDDLQTLDAFSRSQPKLPAPASPGSPAATPPASTPTPQPAAHAPASPASLPPAVALSTPASPVQAKGPGRPPPLLVDKPAPSTVHVAPRLLESEPVAPGEKLLPPPQLPTDPGKEEKPTHVVPKPLDATEKAVLHKAPHLIPTEPSPVATPPPVTSARPSKATGPIFLRDIPTTGVVAPPPKPSHPAAPPEIKVKETPPLTDTKPAKAGDAKPSLKPAVLPNRTLAAPKSAEVTTPKSSAETGAKPHPAAPPAKKETPLPLTRTERAKKRRLTGTVVFYGSLFGVGIALYFGSLFFCRETRVEGQVIPPPGMPLNNEIWIVTDFRDLSAGIAEDLAEARAPLMLEIQERQDHVQRAQADIALREERIRLLAGQIQADKDELAAIAKNARDDAQKIWDGPGAQLDAEYDQRLNDLQKAISDRAKSLKLDYQPDDTYHSPEVWANAYRLALYGVVNGVDSSKELLWLSDQMKQWRDFLKTLDDRKEQLREQAAQIKIAPATKITDLNARLTELQSSIDSTQNEEDPIKSELQQAQADLALSQAADAGLDDKYYKQLDAIPEKHITTHIPLLPNGRFSWVEEESSYAEGEMEHHYWMFARATRPDGRQYWALGRFTVAKDHKLNLLIEPDSFASTKAILRPNLPPEEQAQ